MTRTARLIGFAHTVRCHPGDFLTLLTALAEARDGEVLVVDGGGAVEAALLGKLMALEARRKGVRGFVIDGAVRDVVGLGAVGIPVFARATTARIGTLDEASGWIEVLGIDPDHAGRGIGRAMGEEMLARYRQRGVRRVRTMVDQSMPDVEAFFARLGFAPDSLRPYVKELS